MFNVPQRWGWTGEPFKYGDLFTCGRLGRAASASPSVSSGATSSAGRSSCWSTGS
jgi:hypothetical protein